MTQQGQFRILPRLGWRGWTVLIAWLAILAAVGIAFTVIAFGIFLFLLPVFVVATLLYYLFPPRRRSAPGRPQPENTTIIDGEFRVVDAPEIERGRSEKGN
jgi:hypothetical protein